jgi:hypothetical protein
VQGLDAVDDRHRRPQGLQLLQHQFQVGFGQQLEVTGARRHRGLTARARLQAHLNNLLHAGQAPPAQLHLLGRFLGAHVEHRCPAGHGAGALQQQSALADAGISAQEHQ